MLSTLSSWVQLLWKAEQSSIVEDELTRTLSKDVKEVRSEETKEVGGGQEQEKCVHIAPEKPTPAPVPYETKYRARFLALPNCFVFSEEDVEWEKRQWSAWQKKHKKENEDEIDAEVFREIEQAMIKRKLDRCMTNWMYENTPAGGLFMRYSALDEVFEYYSSHTIPYRYLDATAMRYVTVFGCKPIYVDMDEELERTSKTGYKPTPNPVKWDGKLRNGKTFSLDEYVAWRSKNRNDENSGMLSKYSKKGVSKGKGKPNAGELGTATATISKAKSLKEHANQYVCIGKMCEFQPLQKPPVLDKARKMTYAEYREWKKQQQKKE